MKKHMYDLKLFKAREDCLRARMKLTKPEMETVVTFYR